MGYLSAVASNRSQDTARTSSLRIFLQRGIPWRPFHCTEVADQGKVPDVAQGNESLDWGSWGSEGGQEKGIWYRSTWTNRTCKLGWWMRQGKDKIAVQLSWLNTAVEKETLPFPRESISEVLGWSPTSNPSQEFTNCIFLGLSWTLWDDLEITYLHRATAKGNDSSHLIHT